MRLSKSNKTKFPIQKGEEELHRTPEKKKTVNPVWNDQFNLYIESPFTPITFQVDEAYLHHILMNATCRSSTGILSAQMTLWAWLSLTWQGIFPFQQHLKPNSIFKV